MLADEGTTILKFFLHITKDEQKERLQARLDEPDKHWKFSVGDLGRTRAVGRLPGGLRGGAEPTPAPRGPVVRRARRPQVVPQPGGASEILVETLEGLDMAYPEPEDDLDGIVID